MNVVSHITALGRLLPGLAMLRRYERRWLRADALAGVTVAAYLIPQVMAYAEVAGLAPVAGLWAIMGSLLVYAVFGSSRQLSVGPESTTALLTAVAIAPLAGGDPARYAALAAALALLVGAICVLGWAARLGVLADLLSRPVLVGYLAGIAVIMIVSQLGKIGRVAVDGDSVLAEVGSFAGQLAEVHVPTLLLALAVLAFLLVASRLFPRLPVPLLGVLLATAATALFSLRDKGIQVVGDLPAGVPLPGLPAVSGSDLGALLLPAIGVALVGFNDNVLTARSFAARNGYRIDANAELLALGAANVASGLVRGFPVSSSGSRTVIGDALGSRSQLHSLVALGAVVLAVLVGGPVLAQFPAAALGGLVIYAALRLVELTELRRIAAFRRSELTLALATTLAVLLLGVLYGVLAAIALSILDLLRRVARPHDGILGYVTGLAGMHDIDDYPEAATVPGLVVYRYDAPLCFANADNFRTRALAAVDDAPGPVEWFLLNAEANVEVDLTAVDALDELRAELDRRGITFAMARVKQDLRDYLEVAGLIERVGADRVFPTLPTAVRAYRNRPGPEVPESGASRTCSAPAGAHTFETNPDGRCAMKHRKIKNIMTTDVATVGADTPFKDIVRVLHHRDVSAVPVVSAKGMVLGVVSHADLLPKQSAQEPSESGMPSVWLRRYWDRSRARGTVAGELMTAPAHTIDVEATVVDAARLLDRHGIKRVPVVDESGQLVGIVSRRDLVSVFLRKDEDITDEISHEVFGRNLGIVVNPATVTVEVHDGVVTLRGNLERKSMVPIAEDLSRRVDGVVDVKAELTFTHDDTHLHVPESMAVDITHEPWPDR